MPPFCHGLHGHIQPPADPADPIPQPHPPEVRDPVDEPPKPISDPPPVPTQAPQ
ncbi:MAG: hypothetical protein MUC68_04550 [Burkholderiaceae bacterium]|jgi:hypothetical protein|nr:hypothetical protein [Burkholderiaceae bacterium]